MRGGDRPLVGSVRQMTWHSILLPVGTGPLSVRIEDLSLLKFSSHPGGIWSRSRWLSLATPKDETTERAAPRRRGSGRAPETSAPTRQGCGNRSLVCGVRMGRGTGSGPGHRPEGDRSWGQVIVLWEPP